VTIQWFPGHMTRARRKIEEKLKMIDVVIELLDARIPMASRNPMLDEIVKQKPRVIILNKSDLADAEITRQWERTLTGDGKKALSIDSTSGRPIEKIAPVCRELFAEKIEAQIRKGMIPRSIRALILGIPNVGKSTLINKLAGRSIAATGDKPGVTKAQQWIKTDAGIDLLDTPGILWPKFEDPHVGYLLAVTGAIKEDILHIDDIAFYALKDLIRMYPEALKERYDLEQLPEVDDQDPHPIVEVMEQIGRRRGCVVSGGKVDLTKASGIILRDLRAGLLGRISLEHP
jgi:ribosome biogenesis GTPase A